MKKQIASLLALILSASIVFTSCGSEDSNDSSSAADVSESQTSSAELSSEESEANASLADNSEENSSYEISVEPVTNEWFSLSEEVRIGDDGEWSDKADAKIGDIVQYRVHVKNICDESLDDVTVRASFADGLKYIEGSSQLYNYSNPDGAEMSDNIIKDNGANLGTYNPDAGVWIYFKAEVTGENTGDYETLLELTAPGADLVATSAYVCLTVE